MDNLDWLSQLSSLKYLKLSGIDLHKETNWFQVVNKLPSLLELHLGDCNLNNFIINPSIEYLNLSSLLTLDLSDNNFTSHQLPSEISEKTFSKLSNLDSLDLSSSNFVFQFDLDWVPPFQLNDLFLGNTNQGPNFPAWIYTQKSLQYLDLSSSGISLVDRNKFTSLIEIISDTLYLSNNSMTGDISNLTLKCHDLRLDHNNFTGGLPNISPTAVIVDLSYNAFLGSIPHSWKNLKYLYYINLWSNKLSGEALVHLSGWTQLKIMNLGENEFSGTIPMKMSQDLEVVILRDNQFEGNIPQEIFNLSHLIHLDLANNKLSGSIPNSVYKLTQMVDHSIPDFTNLGSIELFTKGQEYYMRDLYRNRKTIDLSANNLKWRHAYFRFIDEVGDKIYVTLMVIHHVADLSCKSWL
ncbi:hypothetical protein P8452_25560 [Trifolium repens]|nr:hypothetical protein P8452_25560 [Trifolium repens]